MELPALPKLLENLASDLVALYVGQFLDGEHVAAPQDAPYSIEGAFPD